MGQASFLPHSSSQLPWWPRGPPAAAGSASDAWHLQITRSDDSVTLLATKGWDQILCLLLLKPNYRVAVPTYSSKTCKKASRLKK